MTILSKSTSALALMAALSMAATPAAAVEMPLYTIGTSGPMASHAAPAQDAADHHRWRRYRRDRGIDAGDVLAGVLVIGGIAAIASAASKNKRDRDYRNRDYRYRDRDYRNQDSRYRDRRGDSRYDGARGLDNAVNMCVREIERDVRVDTVDEVNRSGEGWRVTGSLYNGDGFTCRIGSDGRIEDVNFGQRSAGLATPATDNQWDDNRYQSARADTGYAVPETSDPQPAYPGGPIDGDLSAE